jgi:hypothetical protein
VSDYIFVCKLQTPGVRGSITAFARDLVSEPSATLAAFAVTFAAWLLIGMATFIALAFQQLTRCIS